MSDFFIENGILEKYCINGNGGNVVIPDGVTEIGSRAFFNSQRSIAAATGRQIDTITVPDSVTKIQDGGLDTYERSTIICKENSASHQYCVKNNIPYIFDYQYESFHGIIPQDFEMLESPFLVDEEKPYIFVSYSHKDRETVLPILKTLYESGWKIWYDEGLTIGDSYDKTIEEHVENCSVFLLFVTKNLVNSSYIEKNEIPWAKQYGRPIIKCILEEGENYEIENADIIGTAMPGNIEAMLENVAGIIKGEKREAKGITVAVDTNIREEIANGDGFAYCIYSEESKAEAKTILHDIINGGGTIYDGIQTVEDEEKLRQSACLVVFLDQALLNDEHLVEILTKAYSTGKDIAMCLLKYVELPPELEGLDEMQWLSYEHMVHSDLNKKLIRHLEKRGCRNTSIIPDFEYDKTLEGIVITRYIGHDSYPKLEQAYGGASVAEIGSSAFENCKSVMKFDIPASVTKIGSCAFKGCINLNSITIPNSITEIQDGTFSRCKNLVSVTIPDSVTEIGDDVFIDCKNLTSVTIPNSVTKIGSMAFAYCSNLASVTIPDSVDEIGNGAFAECSNLASITIPNSVTKIGNQPFQGCYKFKDERGLIIVENILSSYFKVNKKITIPNNVMKIAGGAFSRRKFLKSITIPDSVTEIGDDAFIDCKNLTSVTIPNSVTKIGKNVFKDCPKLTVICSKNSYAERYCIENGIRYSKLLWVFRKMLKNID